MESRSRFAQWFGTFGERIAEQQWFQELKAKWDELDPQSRMYLQVGGSILAALIIIILIFSSVYGVYQTRKEYNTKLDLLNTIQAANDELRKLKETNSTASPGGAAGGAWPAYFESTATNAGMDKASVTISPEKPGTSTETVKESLYDIAVKHVNIRQVVRLAYTLENGARPVKLRNLSIDTKSDPAGYLDATLSVSAFSMVSK